MKKSLYAVFFSLLYFQSYAWTAEDLFNPGNITPALQIWWGDLVFTVDNIAWYIIWLFYFIAVLIWIYWWFQILVSGWDEEKFKKWKNYIIYMVLWLIIIFLASQLVTWIISVMSDPTIVWP